jgi:hypothetical protein
MLKVKSFISFLNDLDSSNKVIERVQLFEHHTYKAIPGTKNSYRVDPENTNTKTFLHSHVYAKPNGGGKELYSVNYDGKGHDGSSGMTMSSVHADFFRGKGYQIPEDNVLECLDLSQMPSDQYTLFIVEIND